MTDNFALLSEIRRPWLEAGALKQKFLSISSRLHPDKVVGDNDSQRNEAAKSFAEVNTAYTCLSDPKLRLLHLLELERGVKPNEIQQIPSALANLFAEVATTCRKTDDFIIEKSKVTSPLLQVQWFERGQEWVETLNTLQRKLNRLYENLLDELKRIDAEWINSSSGNRENILIHVEELYRLFGYFNRWSKQVQERVVQLSI